MIRAHVAEERIGPWAKPKEIRYVTAIPRTANGKIRTERPSESALTRDQTRSEDRSSI